MKSLLARHQLHLGAGLIILFILLLSGQIAWKDRNAFWEKAQQSAQNVRILLANDIGRDIERLDSSLKGVMQTLRNEEIWQVIPELRHRILFAGVTTTPTYPIIVLNELGDIVEDSEGIVPRTGNFADRDYFQVHRKNPNVGAYLSRPFMSRLYKSYHIVLSRRLSHSDGSFAGIAGISIPLASLSQRLTGLDIGRNGTVTLLRDDGIVLMRKPYDVGMIGKDVGRTDNFQTLSREKSGTFEGAAAIDGVQRIFSFSHIDPYPLILNVAYSVEDVFDKWQQGALLQIAVTLVLCLAVAVLLYLFERELALRKKAQAQLAQLARIDALTGLPNRRAFDEFFEREWRRAMRTRSLLSLLYVDADGFKTYNDRYGHAQGDKLLHALARSLEGLLRRPGDFAARYGGEEFLILLPDTDEASAFAMAEKVRNAVLDMKAPHEKSPFGIATVSIGVATVGPREGDERASLLQAADHALYQAKDAGRNRICSFDASQGAPRVSKLHLDYAR